MSNGKPAVVACFGSPYIVARFPEAKTWLAAFSTVDIAQRSAARALFGQVAIGGKMPVRVPEVAQLGEGFSSPAQPMTLRVASSEMDARLKPAYDILNKAVAEGAFPGGVLAVGYKGELAVHAFGKQTYAANAPVVTPDTIYDAASLTKPVVTAPLVAMLAAAGRINLDAPIERYLPEWAAGPNPEWRKKVTVRQLLLHTGGLPAHKKYWQETKNKKELLAKIFAEPLEAEPSTRVEYSDLGYILLGEILERFSGRPLDADARDRIFAPLGKADTSFNPAKQLLSRIAPTENDTELRKRLVHGEVDDQNAWVMGGVAGHAGMFTTAPDLAAYCQMLLNGGIYAHQRVLRRGQIEQLTARQTVGGTGRAPGWDVPGEASSSGRYFSAHSYGHLGYTGTSIWVDPEKELFVILLTNRVHPSAENEKIREVRPAVHDAVVEALGLATKQ